MFYFIYYASFIVVLPGILFALICQLLVTIRFKKYSRVQSSSQWTANEMSDMLLEKQGIRSVEIRKVDGSLTDNYNPSTDVLSLSESVYSGTDIASLGVAAHECGHAVQKHTGSFLLTLRSVLNAQHGEKVLRDEHRLAACRSRCGGRSSAQFPH